MYNEKIKMMYIKENKDENIALEQHMVVRFNDIEKMETSLKKDCSEFSVVNIIEYYQSIDTRSLKTLTGINSRLKQYTDWCINNGITNGENHYAEITVKILDLAVNKKKLNQKIITKEELFEFIESLPNPSEAFIVLALFEGLCGKNYVDLYYADMKDIGGNVIHTYSGKDLTISDELIAYAKKSSETFEFVARSANASTYVNDYARISGEETRIIKRMTNSNIDRKVDETIISSRIRTILRRIFVDSKYSFMSMKTLMESGRISMIKDFMEQDGSTDARETIMKHRDEIESRYGRMLSLVRYLTTYGDQF